MLRAEDGAWSVGVHREFAPLLSEWMARSGSGHASGVFHIGFGRPPARAFDDVADEHPGRLLITASAKFGLPPGYEASVFPVGMVDGLPVHLGTYGWGYTVEEPQPFKAPALHGRQREFSGWVREFVTSFPENARALAESDIYDEDDYLAREIMLNRELRRQAGFFRFEARVEDRSDPCAIARAGPPWLAERPFSSMNLTVRATNVFVKCGIVSVRDLGGHNLNELLRLPNFGRKSAHDVRAALEEALAEGPPASPVQGPSGHAPERTLLESVQRSLLKHSEQARDVVSRRMGLDRPCETLEAIGVTYGLTRERVRQIEAKTVERLIAQESWDNLLSAKLNQLLHDRQTPLPAIGVEAADSWFAGVGERLDALTYLLEKMCRGDVGLLQVDGVQYIAFLDQARWDSFVSQARCLLASGVDGRWSEDRCRLLVRGLLPANSREFRGTLWEKASALCYFTPDAAGVNVLTAYGRGAEQIVEAVLASAVAPLHFTEIAEQASARAKRPIDVRRAHSAAAAVGLLFGRGTYGLERHTPVPPDVLAAIGEEAQRVMAAGLEGRQWHASEILAALRERGAPSADQIDKYVLDIALQYSGGGKRLGRMVWTAEADEGSANFARIEIRQAIASILLQAGRPLHASDIRQRLAALRGVNGSFQIHPRDPLVRLGGGLWGLNDRDLAVKRHRQVAMLNALVEVLERRGVGVHACEIAALRIPDAADIPAEALFSLVVSHDRLRSNAGQYLYLTSWGGSRRESVAEAVEKVLALATHPLTFGAIVTAVKTRIQRPCDGCTVLGCLQAIEAEYDEAARTWFLPTQAAQPDDEPALTA